MHYKKRLQTASKLALQGYADLALQILSNFTIYYKKFINLQDTIDRWQHNDEQLYDHAQPVMVPVRELWPIREYTWSREEARLSPQQWDDLKAKVKKEGWRHSDPAIILVGKAGGVKVGEGNHRLAIAKELGNPKIPVRFVFYEGEVKKNVQHSRKDLQKIMEDRYRKEKEKEDQRKKDIEEHRRQRSKMTKEEREEADQEMADIMKLLGLE